MRRVVPVLLASIFGLVLLLSFHTSPEGGITTSPKVGAEAPSTTAPIAGAGPPGTSGLPGRLQPADHRNRTGDLHRHRRSTTGTDRSRSRSRSTARGSSTSRRCRCPATGAHSQRLSQEAAPILRTEAISTQSARIDVVSGATFTSESYAQSLQSALDQANLGH